MLFVARPNEPGVWLMRMPAWVFWLTIDRAAVLGESARPACRLTLTEPKVLTSMPCWALLLNSVCAPDGLLMFAAPAVMRMPSWFESA
jgi:hypothetical protein